MLILMQESIQDKIFSINKI